MKKVFLFLSLLVYLFTSETFAQSKFYLSAEANFINEAYEVTDEGNSVSAPSIGLFHIPGTTILLGFNFNPIWSLELGIATRPTKQGYKLEYPNGLSSQSQSGNIYYHLPIRTRVRIPLVGDRLFGTASLGAQWSVTNPTRIGQTDNGTSSGSVSRNGVIISSTSAQYTTYHKAFITASAEVGFDFQINPKYIIYSTVSYIRGDTDLNRIDLQYQFENQTVRQASLLHRGIYSSFNFGIRYNFGTHK